MKNCSCKSSVISSTGFCANCGGVPQLPNGDKPVANLFASTAHDSRPDTEAHITRVEWLLSGCAFKLMSRGKVHDASKLEEPEKSGFDRLMALKLSGMAYGSPDYKACLVAEQPAIQHHYAHNSHHPEHFTNGVDGMSLFDVIEMLMDWKAASERMCDGGDIRFSINVNTERFKLSPQLVAILLNTVKECGW